MPRKPTAAQIKGPDNNRLRHYRFGNGSISAVLFFFTRQIVFVQKEKLGSVKSYSFRAGFDYEWDIFGQLPQRSGFRRALGDAPAIAVKPGH